MLALLALATLSPKPLVLAHYMPWYVAKPYSKEWGWHWTMNKFDPDKGQIASQYHPLIGPYDSSDPDVIEYEVLTMKLSGIDGAIIDWYGYDDVYDYATNHRNTLKFIEVLKKAGMKFAICYEDQTLPNLIKFGKVKEQDAVPYAQKLVGWMKDNWFSSPSYVKLNGKPLFLVFGPQYYKAPQWKEILGGQNINSFGVMFDHDSMTGGFAWPNPNGGMEKCNADYNAFYDRAKKWPIFVAGAYPRFNDVYEKAGIHPTYGVVDDRKGQTFADTFKQALASKAPVIQLITWNDWGEGTAIEPSTEFGYRDVKVVQALANTYKPSDLDLPFRLYKLRKAGKNVDRASQALFKGRIAEAAKALENSSR